MGNSAHTEASGVSSTESPSSLHGASTQGSVLATGLMTRRWLSCPHRGIHPVPSEVSHQLLLQKGTGPCYLYQPHARVSTATGHAESTMHLYRGKWADPWTPSNSNRSLENVWDTYKELNLDANLKLNAAQMKVAALMCAQLALAPTSLFQPCLAASVTGRSAWLVPCHSLRWLCCSGDSLCSLQIWMSPDSVCTLAA